MNETMNVYLQSSEMNQKGKCIAWYLSNHIFIYFSEKN